MAQEDFVLLQAAIALERNLVEEEQRIAAGGLPKLGIDAAEKFDGILVPAPPQVLGECVQMHQAFRQFAAHEHTGP